MKLYHSPVGGITFLLSSLRRIEAARLLLMFLVRIDILEVYSILFDTSGNGTYALGQHCEFKNIIRVWITVSQSESMLIIGPVHGTASNGRF